ncbi:MAG TPA: MBL fold metallo-hydrolase [Methanocorpusculum sp.]|nr:MBL fold metallo-hydrolase [Methanocorpusculum sp.]HJK62638.1 MBL fold metallo-hydrolase [Methanocorpusculum sp.]HJK63445.1 MBL fold metallo-hydrolase [Methanocorpusculum sp.]HJK68454.1 MBL fold metallo-hydrolase [Methanocorpusculum sp.]
MKTQTNKTKVIIYVVMAIITTSVLTAGCISADQIYTVPAHTNLTLHFVAVGQADAIVIQQGDTYAIVDAGKPLTKDPAATDIMTYLKTIQPETIDFLLITHQDYDHIGYAQDILQEYPTNIFYDNGFVHTSKTYENLMEEVGEQNIPYIVVRGGDSIENSFENVSISVLAPQKLLSDDINANSIILRICYGNQSALLTGDAENPEELLSSGPILSPLHSDLLKVGHHGSAKSSSGDFLNRVSPDIAVISTGKNSYGHPNPQTVNRLIEAVGSENLYLTSGGTVIATTDGIHDWYITQVPATPAT